MNPPESVKKTGVSRRRFLKAGALVAVGTTLGAYFGRDFWRRKIAETAESMDIPSDVSEVSPDMWLEILPDNRFRLHSPKVEMGQGVFTGFAMMVAEELSLPLDRIEVVTASSHNRPLDALGTGGSNSTLSLFKPIREVAATMREMLRLSAAKIWGLPLQSVQYTPAGLVAADKVMGFFEVAQKTQKWDIPDTPPLKPRSAFTVIGQEVKRTDLATKVTGRAVFGIDAAPKDALYGVVLRSPFIEARLKSVNTKPAEQVKGVVKVVQEGDFVAVVAQNRFAAEKALSLIEADWECLKKWQQADIEAAMTVGRGNKVSLQKVGNAANRVAENSILSQEYRTPLGAHAHMEPNGAWAAVTADGAKVVTASQNPSLVRDQVADFLNIDKDKVVVETPFLGGGFGRKSRETRAIEAVRLSKAVGGQPVMVFNTREQEFENTFYRPNTHHVLKASVENGRLSALTHEVATGDMVLEHLVPGSRLPLQLLGADVVSSGHGAGFVYEVPHKYAAIWHNDAPVPVGIWRSVGIFANTFAIESFMDEIARHLGKDPIDWRLAHLNGTDPIFKRYQKVLETVREKSGWLSPKKAGVGRGVALANDRKTITATVVEVQWVDGDLKVTKATNVTDAGFVINPEGVRMQAEGCIMMGLSASLFESVSVADGQIQIHNFNDYPVAKLADTPDISVTLIEGADEPYGAGEPPIAVMPAAIANAIFDLTGQRIRHLPLLSELKQS